MGKLTLILFLMFVADSCQNKNRNENIQNQTNEVIAGKDTAYENKLSDSDSISKIQNINSNSEFTWFQNEVSGSAFQKAGIQNPAEFIENSLRKKPELIPAEGVLGGTMKFERIQLLGEKWVIADYSDGHIQGRSIYEFSLDSSKNIRFKIMASARR